MSDARDAALLAQLSERLRQERELFDQQKAQDRRIFVLRMAMGWVAVALLVAICALAAYIILNHADFSAATVTAATSALLVEALGLVIGVWRVTVGKGPRELRPTTQPGGGELLAETESGGK
jgi:hypothetical protein